MVQRTSVRQERLTKELGGNIRRWRKVNGMSASDLAARAFVTRETLKHLEDGTGAPRVESLIAVLTALGIVESMVDATNPYRSDAARARIDEIIRAGGTV